MFSADTTLSQIYSTPEFSGFAHRLLPIDLHMSSSSTLKQLSQNLPWYSTYTRTERTVSIFNELRTRASQGQEIFFDIYTAQEQKQDPSKRNTGLVFFKGKKNHKTAIVSAGGAFQYVGAIQDSFPHCQYLAEQGFNAFALIYRPGARTGSRDLARAIVFLHEHANELEIDMTGYSLWGGSAGARLSAWLGSLGTQAFDEPRTAQPSTVVMEYTGLSEVYGTEPPTISIVGTSDWIADYRVMQERTRKLSTYSIPADCLVYNGLGHGFGLGEDTAAQGWIDLAINFWMDNLDTAI
ncbi:alpha/beta hydrolase [Alloscardovia theropitheci]|uniref:Alpha/beta hydrolase n=1 Tax=Alloscardovia theropitheci TaxID=2496842 RepID=A0A4R0QP88_9BIFI|nr:alpha/beta hydrolase [Alloscardovia theropitheci]